MRSLIDWMIGDDNKERIEESLKRNYNIYFRHFSGYTELSAFLFDSTKEMFLRKLKPITEIWYEYSQIKFKKDGDINSLITLSEHKREIIDNWNRYGGAEVEVYGFLKSYNEIGIYPNIYEGCDSGYPLYYKEASIALLYNRRNGIPFYLSNCEIEFDSSSIKNNDEYLEKQSFLKMIGKLTRKGNQFYIDSPQVEPTGLEKYADRMDAELWRIKNDMIEEYTINPPDDLLKQIIIEHYVYFDEHLTHDEAKDWVGKSKVEQYVVKELFEIL